MNDRLEDFVRDHHLEFDTFEPGEDLWEGIEKKIGDKRKHSVKFYLSRAAAVAAIFIFSFGVQQFFMRPNAPAQAVPELMEAEQYYTGIINTKLQEVKPMLVNYPVLEEEMEHDLIELDSVYKGLKDDLKDNAANQEVLEAMVDNYRLRIDILEEMLHFLDKADQDDVPTNNSEYEL